MSEICAKSLQSCLTLCDPVDCSLWGSSLRGILQARVLEWVAISFSRGFAAQYIYNSRYHNYFSLKKHEYFCFDKCQSVFDKTLNSQEPGFPLLVSSTYHSAWHRRDVLNISSLTECIIQHREYSQYFVVTVNEI